MSPEYDDNVPNTDGSVLAHRLRRQTLMKLELAVPWLGIGAPIVGAASLALAALDRSAAPLALTGFGGSLAGLLTSLKRVPYEIPRTPIDDSPANYLNLCRSLIASPNALEREHLYCGKFESDPGLPLLIHLRLLIQNVHATGTSGHGKTSSICGSLNLQLLYRGDHHPLILDLKGDWPLFNMMWGHTVALGLPFRFFNPTTSATTYYWDVLNDSAMQRMSADEKAELICLATGIAGGQTGERRFFSGQNTATLGLAISQLTGRLTFGRLADLLESPQFRKRNNISDHQFNFLSDIRTTLRWLSRIAPLNPPADAPEAAAGIDLGRDLDQPGVTYMFLQSLGGQAQTQTIGRLAICLATAHKRLNPRGPINCVCTIDEYQQVHHQNILTSIKQSRGSGLFFILSHQGLDDLITEDRNLTGGILTATSVRMACSAMDEQSRRYFTLASGEKIYIREATSESTTHSDLGVTRTRSRSLSEYLGTALTQNDLNRLNATPGLVLVEATPHSGFTRLNRPVLVRMPFAIPPDWFKYYSEYPPPEPEPGRTIRVAVPEAAPEPTVEPAPPIETRREEAPAPPTKKRKRRRGPTPEEKQKADDYADRLRRFGEEDQ